MRGAKSRAERHSSTYGRAALGLRSDGKLSFHQFDSLLHANETESLALHCRFRVKPHSSVMHAQLDAIRHTAEFHLEMPRAAMFHCVLKSFLQNPEEREGYALRQTLGNTLGVNLDLRPMFFG